MNAKLPLSLVASLLIAGSAYADGNITGTVYDKGTSEPLDFATVVLVNPETGVPLSMGAMTDENGMFVIPNAPSGKYIIRVSMVAGTRNHSSRLRDKSWKDRTCRGCKIASGSGGHRTEKSDVGQLRT